MMMAPPCGPVSPDFCENPAGYGVFDHDHTDHGQKRSRRVDVPIDPFPKLETLIIK